MIQDINCVTGQHGWKNTGNTEVCKRKRENSQIYLFDKSLKKKTIIITLDLR